MIGETNPCDYPQGTFFQKQPKNKKMQKILINTCYGGFGVSDEAIELWFSKKGLPMRVETTEYGYKTYYHGDDMICCINRKDPTLIEIFEEIGSERTSGDYAKLVLVELPEFCQYRMGEYDGTEWIEETWIEVSIDDLTKGLSEEQLAMALKVDSIKISKNN
jgi:hypothetical protein